MARRKGAPPAEERPPKVPRRKGALLDRATDLVAVLFALSLVAQRVVTG